jgi:8-oxo-dGTP pyrophosphatase MutT (NUDIX family)
MQLTEALLTERLQAAYQPGVIASTDGYADPQAALEMACAAVLLPLTCIRQQWHLILTRRTDKVEHHKGQVSFPGGRCDSQESFPEATALRESREEIGLAPTDVRLLGRLNDILTITRFRVTPVVGVVPWPYPFVPAPAEVQRVFHIPLAWLADRSNWREEPLTPQGVPRPVPVVTYRLYDGERLWGASARITLNFLEALGL